MFKVPKKVNRHVLKAINILSEGSIKKPVSTAIILDQVKYQMRHSLPVPNVEEAIQSSLYDLSDLGLIQRVGPNRFSIAHTFTSPTPHPPRPNAMNLLSLAGSRKRRADGEEASTSRRREHIGDSLSRDELDQTRKRIHRIDRKLPRSGKGVAKVRQHLQQHTLGYECECSSCVPVQESNVLYHNISYNSDPSVGHAEPLHQILEVPGSCEEFSSCFNKQLNEASKRDSNTESALEQKRASEVDSHSNTTIDTVNVTGEQSSSLKEQTEKFEGSASSAPGPTNTIHAANAMEEALPESSRTTNTNYYLN